MSNRIPILISLNEDNFKIQKQFSKEQIKKTKHQGWTFNFFMREHFNKG